MRGLRDIGGYFGLGWYILMFLYTVYWFVDMMLVRVDIIDELWNDV